MSKHTKEPWCLLPGDLIFVSKVGGAGYIAKMMPLDAPRDRKGLPTDISDEMCANARRIVACVNACAGVSNGELAMTTMSVVLARMNEAEQQRDELLTALDGVLQWVAYGQPDDLNHLDRAHAAIRNAKGGAA